MRPFRADRPNAAASRPNENMSCKRARIAIVGGGLSGLYAAYLLTRRGTADWVLFEARPTLGGRVLSLPVSVDRRSAAAAGMTGALDRFDLGPTWFWPELQPHLNQLIDALAITRFAQHEAGDMMVERSAHEPAARAHGYVSAPASVRLAGGMGALVEAVSNRLDPARVLTGHIVRGVRRGDAHAEIDVEDTTAGRITWRVDHVLLALPPRLVMQAIDFSPPLPAALSRQWRATPTWMAGHAKYVAVYDEPFWHDSGLSGEARSARGPLVEIHDASMPGGSAALFGFVGVPARVRHRVAEDAFRSHCRAQLVRLFGERAARPRAEFFKDWSTDPYTATREDLDAQAGHHLDAPPAAADHGPWRARVTGIASEWSPRFPGYLAGCVDAARAAVGVLTDPDAAAKRR
jgi:monoamine oxidase